ncbi:TonB-dependent receptor [Vibrio sp. TH_r3]|uniref:TonB-dependent receptor plug domain-containing protein n=1 Tax=Vibrio sp. TH_r3 TaxID=3082084 RepID=UPI0029530B25|nr:TonB-dependent receptor [Vibrio sp. TH_r3]MDV7103484.1 TonB-dependent receptor [Vibrio sp. TH_r3]
MRFIYLAPLAFSGFVYANEDSLDIPSLDLESLMATDVQVTAAMKRLQSTSETAASIYVLSNDELVKSGVTSIPQALTMVPGIQVRKIDNNVWAITARATAGRYSSKLLVMVDGQSVHNPGFAGVDWESINVPIFDIERIEVVRGQSGLLWGSNATSGVVNIITKHSEDTRGSKVQLEMGSQLEHQVVGRFGSDLGDKGSFRVYASDRESDSSSRLRSRRSDNNVNPSDYGNTSSFGLRTDLIVSDDVSFIFQGDYTRVNNGQTVSLANLQTNEGEIFESKYQRNDVKLMSRLEHRMSDLSNQMLQLSYSGLNSESAYNDENFDVVELEYQMNTLLSNVRFDWGLNYQYSKISSNDDDKFYVTYADDFNSTETYGAFVQAQFELIPEQLNFSIGNRSEYNDFTGWEHQPIARLTWLPDKHHVFWSSVSQGVRIPSLVEFSGETRLTGKRVGDVVSSYTDVTLSDSVANIHLPFYLYGSQDIEAETTLSSEIGYRYLQSKWNIDLSFFHNQSDNVLALDFDENAVDSSALIAAYGQAMLTNDFSTLMALLSQTSLNYTFVSNAKLKSYGSEIVFGWQPIDRFKAEIGYSFTSIEYDLDDGYEAAIGSDAYLSQLFLKSSFALTPDHYLFALYRYEEGDAYQTNDFGVLDISWSWMLDPNWMFSLTGNNLLAGDHLEYANTNEAFTVPTYIEQSIAARISVSF